MSDINLVELGWEESIPRRGKGHVQRPWGGSQQHVFCRNYKVSEAESKGELQAGIRGYQGDCGIEWGSTGRDKTV